MRRQSLGCELPANQMAVGPTAIDVVWEPETFGTGAVLSSAPVIGIEPRHARPAAEPDRPGADGERNTLVTVGERGYPDSSLGIDSRHLPRAPLERPDGALADRQQRLSRPSTESEPYSVRLVEHESCPAGR